MTLKDDVKASFRGLGKPLLSLRKALLSFPYRKSQMLYDYTNFVFLKASLPNPISPYHYQLIHAALGLATEVLELQQSTTRENTEEELGDLLWYLCFLARALDITTELGLEQAFEAATTDTHANTLPQEELAAKIEGLVSNIKKVVIYQQDKNLEESFVILWMAFCRHCKACDFSLEQLITSNKEKLEKRYKKSFTTEESASRNDKDKS